MRTTRVFCMASLTTTPSRLLRSPTAYPFAVFFVAAAFDALAAFGFFAAFAGLSAAFVLAAAFLAAGAETGGATISGAPPRSRWIVYARARSRRACPIREGFLATPIASWKRRLKISSDRSRAFCVSSSSDRSRHFAAFIGTRLRSPLQTPRSHHELGRDAHLVGRRAERLARHVLGDALHLVQDPARFHHGHPLLGVALALAHPRLRRLLRHRLVGKHADPHLAAALETPRQRHARRLDLAVRHPAGLQRLQAIL